MSHSKGPWKLTEDNNVIAFNGSEVMLVAETSREENHSYKSNAALMAAAPEMLDSLKKVYTPFCELVDQINQFHPEGLTSGQYMYFMSLVQEMHEAIKKAEGK